VKEELRDLEDKLTKLYEFNNSERFNELKNKTMKSLLWAQYDIMGAYRGILEALLAGWEEEL
jgi:hypothetical protein